MCIWLFLFTAILRAQNITVDSLIISGNVQRTDDEIAKLLETKKNSGNSSATIERDIQAILNYYSAIGFPFASVTIDSAYWSENTSESLVLQLTIKEGPKFFIDEIRVEGNSATNANVVVREMRLKRNELFNQERLRKFHRRLERLQLFSSVAEPQLYVSSNIISDSLHGGVIVAVKEGSANSFDGILGYVPNLQTNKGYFTGNIFVAMRNLFGTGRKAMVRWQRETETTQELELQYYEPWIFSIPFTMNGAFFQRKQDSSFVKTKIDLRGEYAVSDELSFAGNAASETVVPSSAVASFSVFQSDALLFGGEILYDTRDFPRNPTGGVRYFTSVQRGTKRITGPEQYLSLAQNKNFNINKIVLDVESYFTTYTRQVIAVQIHGKQITSTQLEISDLYQVGGTNSIRGYRENQFFASQVLWMNNEYRFLTGRASSLFGFFDGGYFSRPEDQIRKISKQSQTLYGYGVGAKIETGVGLLSISFALGKGDSFSQGKLHVGIVNEF